MRKKINYILILLIVFNVVFVLFGAFFYPMASIDAISIWLLKAKAFYITRGFPVDILKNSIYLNTHPQYPIFVPFIFFIFYILLGGINEKIIAFINPLFYIFILLLVYKLLKELKYTTTVSLLLTYIYSMFSTLLAQAGRKHSGDADIFIVFMNWITLFLSYKFTKTKNYKIFCLLIVLIMLSSQIKGEGLFLASILFFLPVSNKEKIISIIISFVPFVIWRLVINYYQIPNDFFFLIPSLSELFSRSFNILYYTLREMLKINNWYIFWPVFLIYVFLNKNWSNFIKKFIFPSLIAYCTLFFIFYLFLSVDPKIYVPISIDRILLQLSPFYFLVFTDAIQKSKILQLYKNSEFLENLPKIVRKFIFKN